MNENPFEDGRVSVPEQAVENTESPAERSAEMLSEVFAQIKNIEGTEEVSVDEDFGMAKLGERVNADQSDIEVADRNVRFQERMKVLNEKSQEIRQAFETKVRKALLPVAAALTMNFSPAIAEEARTEQIVITPEVPTVVVKTETREVGREDVFDRNSPLAQSSEMKKKFDRQVTSEELSTLGDLRTKVWEAKNEWMSLSGRDKDGKYVMQMKEAGLLGGIVALEIGEDMKDKVLSHTHPVDAIDYMTGSSKSIHDGKQKAFIMPPSIVDVVQCMDDASTKTLQRVVDPRGVWEYRCDGDHPFVQSREKLAKEALKAMEDIQTKYSIDKDDFQKAFSSFQDAHPAFIITKAFGMLETKYPGVKEGSRNILRDISKSNTAIVLSALEYDKEGSGLAVSSLTESDEETAKKITKFIENAEKRGIYISYTPFKEPPRMMSKPTPADGSIEGE